MEVTARLNYLRTAPRKMRLIADLIRGKKAPEAKNILRFLPRRGAMVFSKLLDSGLANAKNNFALEENNLYLTKVLVDEGPKLKRWRPRARGRAFPIQKKTSHLTIVLEEMAGGEGKEKGEKRKRAVGLRKKETIPERKKGFRPALEKKIARPLVSPLAKKIFRRKAM